MRFFKTNLMRTRLRRPCRGDCCDDTCRLQLKKTCRYPSSLFEYDVCAWVTYVPSASNPCHAVTGGPPCAASTSLRNKMRICSLVSPTGTPIGAWVSQGWSLMQFQSFLITPHRMEHILRSDRSIENVRERESHSMLHPLYKKILS
jgi:hypothetical protein